MRRSSKWWLLTLAVLALIGASVWFTRRETSTMEQIQRYANGPVLTLSRENGAVVIEAAASVPADARVRYTLDGSLPTADSPCYTDPIPIVRGDGDTITVVRAALFYRGQRSDAVDAAFLPEGFSLPEDMLLISLTTDPRNLYDYESGILVEGKVRDDFIASGNDRETLAFWQRPANFTQRGDEWVRDGFAAFFDHTGALIGSQSVGISVSGTSAAYMDIKSFKLTSRWTDPDAREFPAQWVSFDNGEKTPWAQPGSYNKLSLKNGGQDRNYNFLITPTVYPLARQAGLTATPDTRFAMVYLNGEFYSYMYVQQHIDRDYLADQYGVEKACVEWMQFGEAQFIQYLGLDGLLEGDVNDPQVAEALERVIDVDNLLLYYAFEMAVNNRDAFANNFGVWRYTGTPDPANPYTDGRVRFVLFDVDVCLRNGSDIVTKVTDPQNPLYSRLFAFLMEKPLYRSKFLTIQSNLFSTTLSPDTLCAQLDRQYEQLTAWRSDPRIAPLMARSVDPQMVIESHFAIVRDTAAARADVMRGHLQRFLAAGSTYQLTVSVDAPGSVVCLENLRITSAEALEGQYFRQSDLTMTAVPGPGRRFSHWLVNGQPVEGVELHLESGFFQSLSTLRIEMITEAEEEGCPVISELSARGKLDWIELQNAGGSPVELSGLFITNKPSKPFRCRLPAITLEPGETVVLNCKNSLTLAEYLVNFNLSAGETLWLTDGEGRVLSSVAIPKLDADKSYGLDPDTGEYRFYPAPSRGEPNP